MTQEKAFDTNEVLTCLKTAGSLAWSRSSGAHQILQSPIRTTMPGVRLVDLPGTPDARHPLALLHEQAAVFASFVTAVLTTIYRGNRPAALGGRYPGRTLPAQAAAALANTDFA